MMSRHTPHFKRQSVGRSNRSRLDDKWRKPRGTGNKQRQKLKQTWPIVSIGYSRKKTDRGKHPSGLMEVLVHNLSDLKKLKDVKNIAIRIASSVGLKKRLAIEKEAESRDIKVLNKTSEEKLEKLKSKQKKKEKAEKAKSESKAATATKTEKTGKSGKSGEEKEKKGEKEKDGDKKKKVKVKK